MDECMNSGCGLPENERCTNEDMANIRDCPNFDPLVNIRKSELEELKGDAKRLGWLGDALCWGGYGGMTEYKTESHGLILGKDLRQAIDKAMEADNG